MIPNYKLPLCHWKQGEQKAGVEEKESIAVEGADRAKGNRSSTYPHLHIFLSRVWRKRIGEYVSMSPEQNHTVREAYGRSASYSEALQARVGRTSPLTHSWKEHGEAQ